MAIDTYQKRFSACDVISPWRGAMVVPSGTVTQAERQAIAFLYSGILAGAPVIPTLAGFLTLMGAGQ